MGWGKGSVKVLRIHKMVLRTIKGMHNRESCRPIFKELKVPTVTALYALEMLIYVNKNF